jgi:methyltransferase (TIGR00027 family)
MSAYYLARWAGSTVDCHALRRQRVAVGAPRDVLGIVRMRTDQHSRTAVAVAFMRAQHHLHDEPKVMDDPYAQRLLTAGEMAAITERYVRDGAELGITGGDRQSVLARTLRTAKPAAFVLARARYTEDRLAMAFERGVGQYVLVGAGLDTFAFRRVDMRQRLQVFELDHPSSQAFKRERLAAAGLTAPPNLHFGTVDFERESVAEALARLPFRSEQPAVFAWLGVTMYLTRPAIEATWRALRSVAAAGSELVFDFIQPTVLSETASARVQQVRERTRAAGEAMITGIEPAALGADLDACGWTLIEHVDAPEIERRWFPTRTDGYVVGSAGHLACAGIV